MKSFFFILFLFISTIVFAQTVKFSSVDLEINKTLYDGNWQIADSLIEIQLQQNPNMPKYHFFKAYSSFYARYIGNNRQGDRAATIRQVQKYTWDAITLGKKSKQTTETKFYIGSSYAFLARVNIMSGEFWNGYWNAGKAEDYLEEVIEEDPNCIDAYLALGVHEYFPTVAITGFQGFLAWIGGMSGDKELGLNYFNKVEQDGVIFKNEAKYILALVLGFRENDYAQSYKYWRELSDEFSNNNGFQTQKTRNYFLSLVEKRGVEFLVAEKDSLQNKYNLDNVNTLNGLGYNLMNQERHNEALTVFKVNLDLYPNIANCYDSFAECYMNLGDNENAIKYYKIAYRKLDTDSTANDDFKQRVRDGIKESLAEMGSEINY
ncbi:MAG: tetratricopeptide repeat protein [Ignavibacteriae bacterium]|nr:tetratricopeptide repeat protein [Ignavibacteriota bacterium]